MICAGLYDSSEWSEAEPAQSVLARLGEDSMSSSSWSVMSSGVMLVVLMSLELSSILSREGSVTAALLTAILGSVLMTEGIVERSTKIRN